MWFSWNKVGIGFEFCDMTLYIYANLSKFLFIILYVKRGQSKSYKKALLNFVYFVNVLAILLQNFAFYQI